MPIESKRTDSGVALIALSGRLIFGRDLEQLEATVKSLVEQGSKRFVLDASTLDYVDSAAIGTLVSCLTNVKKAGGDLRMAGATPRVLRLLGMTGVDRLMPIYGTVAEASAS
jgi:anti-anti-sigma factor